MSHLENWNWIRTFLVVAQRGSLSAAAEELGLSQPTVSRQVQQLEVSTGVHLFSRSTSGLQLTPEGESLVDSAQTMDQAAWQFQRQLAGRSSELSGDVRISTSEIVGQFMLPPAIVAFRREWPSIHVDTVVTNRVSSLSKGEADLALRMVRPEQPDLVVRRLADVEIGFFAHRSYLAGRSEPDSLSALSNHVLIGPDQDTAYQQIASHLGWSIDRSIFQLRSDSLPMQLALVRAGAGIGVLHKQLATHWPDLVPVLTTVALPPIQLWLVCHGDVQYNKRVKTLQSFLIDWFDRGAYANALT